MSTEDIKEWITGYNEEALIADGFDDAIIGMCESFGNNPVVAYDRDKCIDILVAEFQSFGRQHPNEDEGSDIYEEADDYFSYNVSGAYVGENTPIFITLYFPNSKR